ncbi:MAG: hypothetical protein H7A25_04890 [Leptospiraceae bacterium]|nr:hypothetical protein [Leptospiraceae bacterium]MCP5499211.1 hypothetical protein [Leptospiraceae bacterium]MCP5499214.1 hypothetical protein [Leptospiraceae bacterium]
MVREIITPQTKTITIEIPDEYIGKTIEVLVFDIIAEVEEIEKNGRNQPIKRSLERFYKSLDMFTDDFIPERIQPDLQEREGFT